MSHDFHIVIDRDFPVEKFTVGGLYDATDRLNIGLVVLHIEDKPVLL